MQQLNILTVLILVKGGKDIPRARHLHLRHVPPLPLLSHGDKRGGGGSNGGVERVEDLAVGQGLWNKRNMSNYFKRMGK